MIEVIIEQSSFVKNRFIRNYFSMWLKLKPFKKDEDETTNETREITINDNNKQKITKSDKNIIEKVNRPRDRKEYLNEYYQNNKDKIKEQIKENEKNKTYRIRLLREINHSLIDIKTVRASRKLINIFLNELNIYIINYYVIIMINKLKNGIRYYLKDFIFYFYIIFFDILLIFLY